MPGNSKLKADTSSITHGIGLTLWFHMLSKRGGSSRKTPSCVYFGFCFVLYFGLVSACHNLGITPFLNLIRIWDYTDPALLFLVSAEQALLALSTQITAMLLWASVCLAMNSSVLTYHLSLRPEKEIIFAFLLLAHIHINLWSMTCLQLWS